MVVVTMRLWVMLEGEHQRVEHQAKEDRALMGQLLQQHNALIENL